MTPKEKALKLCQVMAYTSMRSSFNDGFTLPFEIAKKCAMVLIEEIILSETDILNFMHCFNDKFEAQQDIDFWQQVKIEIEKL